MIFDDLVVLDVERTLCRTLMSGSVANTKSEVTLWMLGSLD